MKTYFLQVTLLALILLPGISFSQNQIALAETSSAISGNTIKNRPANFPNLGKYLGDNLEYSDIALQNGVEGLVTVEAMIGEQGEILSVGLVNGIGFGCDESVLELVSNMPDWTAAVENGRNVSQKVLIRARFRLK